MLPNFECAMNIWDTQFNNCAAPENIVPNYTVNIAIHTPNYMREQSEFMYRLKMFIKNYNKGTFKQPMLGKREVDLYRLFREVTAHGGCENVIKKEGTWSRIYRGMDNYSPTETSASYRLKKMSLLAHRVTRSYNKYLIDYEKEVFNFRTPSSHSDFGYRPVEKMHQSPMMTPSAPSSALGTYPQSPTLGAYPQSPTLGAYPQSPQSQKSIQYQQFQQWQQKLQQPLSAKRYPYPAQASLSPPPAMPSLSPMYQQYSPLMVPAYQQPLPYVPPQKPYYDMYGMSMTPQGYDGFEGEKRFRSATPREVGVRSRDDMQVSMMEAPMPGANSEVTTPVPRPDEGYQTLLALRHSISPMPMADSTGYESGGALIVESGSRS